nr:RNase A-like domain-containing protein [uncultured Dongia sp.]
MGESQLGDWQDGQFKFASPDSERQWAIEAYRSGVSAKDWHRGTPVDDKTRDLVLNNLAGATPPYFRGPDGQYRFSNAYTVEPQDVRDHRLRALRGVKIDDLTGPDMPGEADVAAQFAAIQAPQQTTPAKIANDNEQPSALAAKPPAGKAAAKTPTGFGRFAHMAAAQKEAGYLSPEEALQHIDDGIRLLANGLTLGYADNVAAAGDAAIASLSGGEFGPNYDKNIASQKARTQEARDRSGVIGTVIESLPQLVPGAGDALGLGGDIQMYLNDPSKLTLGNAGMTALGILPFVPSVASSINKIDEALETAAKVEAKVANKADDAAGIARTDADAALTKSESEVLTPRFDPDDPAALDIYLTRPIRGNEGRDGHVISKHVGKTKEELLARYTGEPHITGSSSFTDYETMEKVVLDGVKHNQTTIIAWMKDPSRQTLFLAYESKTPVGTTVLKDGTVMPRSRAQIVLKKDDQGGFYFFTAYPSERP